MNCAVELYPVEERVIRFGTIVRYCISFHTGRMCKEMNLKLQVVGLRVHPTNETRYTSLERYEVMLSYLVFSDAVDLKGLLSNIEVVWFKIQIYASSNLEAAAVQRNRLVIGLALLLTISENENTIALQRGGVPGVVEKLRNNADIVISITRFQKFGERGHRRIRKASPRTGC